MDASENKKGYIDIDDALKRVGGNKGLYIRLLGRFIDGNHIDGLGSALSSGDLEAAAHLAHTLKGVSSNLSLQKVASLSAALEQAVKNGEDHKALWDELTNAYAVTIELIAEISE